MNNQSNHNSKFQFAKTNINEALEREMKFSFKYSAIDHKKFSISNKKAKYFKKVIERLKNISSWTFTELKGDKGKTLRFNYLDFSTSSEKSGFSHLNIQHETCKPYEFSISSNEHGRVHGFVNENTFYIVWFDPDHKLFPNANKKNKKKRKK